MCRAQQTSLLNMYEGCSLISAIGLINFIASALWLCTLYQMKAGSFPNRQIPSTGILCRAVWKCCILIQHSHVICPVWSTLAVRMKKAWVLSHPLSTKWRLDQTGWKPTLIWVFAGCTLTLLVLLYCCSTVFLQESNIHFWPHVWRKCYEKFPSNLIFLFLASNYI